MLSRVADSLYWMSRYLERAEHTTRLLDVNLNLMLDESAASAERRWQRVLQALGRPKDIQWTGEPYALTQALTFDTTNKASILSCIIAARENSRHVREQISTELWHRLNSLYLEVTRPEMQMEMQAAGIARPSEFLQSTIARTSMMVSFAAQSPRRSFVVMPSLGLGIHEFLPAYRFSQTRGCQGRARGRALA